MTTHVITLRHEHVTPLTASVSTICFLLEIMFILKAIKSHFKGRYDKQNLTLVFILNSYLSIHFSNKNNGPRQRSVTRLYLFIFGYIIYSFTVTVIYKALFIYFRLYYLQFLLFYYMNRYDRHITVFN